MKIVQHRPMKGVIKSVTVEQTPTNKYYASILVEYENQVPEVELHKFIGLDFSMHDLYVTSEGERANYPRFLRRHEKKLRFGKSVSDNSFGKFREMLSYKLKFRGKRLIQIDKWYASSQLCHVCGYKNPEVKDLSIRQWQCPSCGREQDRDINAAINIREEGKRQITTVGHTGSNACGEGVHARIKTRVRHSSSSRAIVQSSGKQEAYAS